MAAQAFLSVLLHRLLAKIGFNLRRQNMKTDLLKTLSLALALIASANHLAAQATAFTYQGALNDQGAPANGVYDLQFNLFAVPTGGSPIGSLVAANDTPISNGLFTVTLDFGAGQFTGAARWLEVRVRPGDSSGPFTNVAPRQAVLPTPYAIYSGTANAAGLVGTIAASSISDGTITSNKLAANSITSLHLATGAVTTTDLAVDAVTASRLADSFQSGFISRPASSPGTNLTINFPRPFEAIPLVTLDSAHIFPTNVTISNFQIHLPPYNLVVDNSPNVVGRELSMAVVNGNPAIAYYDETSGDLKYCRALTTNGSAWGAPVVAHVGGASLVGRFPSLAVVNGRPAVAYFDDTADDLKYLRANDADGATWPTAVTVASSGNVGQYAKLKVVNGRPAIAYYDSTTFSLQFVRANDADGVTWPAPVTVEPGDLVTNIVGEYASLEIVNGNPAIAYRARSADVLRYSRALDADGSAWAMPVEISNYPQAGEEVSLAVVNGRPAVAYLARGAELHFERAQDTNGTNWIPISSPVAGVRDIFPSGIALRVVAGLPRIAFWHGQGGDVHYTESPFANGGNWKTPTSILGGMGTAGGGVALIDLHGKPVVAAMASTANLHFSIAAALPNFYTAREAVKIEATSVAAGTITREMLAPGVCGTAGPDGAMAFGRSLALNEDAFAIGASTASGLSSFAGGLGSTATGQGSMAFGWAAQAMAPASLALGDNALADISGQVAVGRFNRPNSGAVFIVGNGSFSGRNNAMWVESDGDLEITGLNARKPGGGSWAVPSDGRLKNIEAAFERGLDALRGINPVAYHYKPDNAKHLPSEPRFIGLVAQEVEQHIPEAVSKDEQGYRQVNNDPIIWTMFNAIKQLEARTPTNESIRALNKNLEEQNRSLRAELYSLNQRLADLEKLITDRSAP